MVGGPDYYGRARMAIERLDLGEHVRLTGLVPRETVWQLYDEHDVLVFPSTWPEPFSITLLEAMAAGAVVVTTLTGGTGELARDGYNCLAFEPEDAAGCAAVVGRVLRDPELASRLRTNARRQVEERHSLDTMAARVERALRACARGTSQPTGAR
jgi:glycosyltransferase involved in cell wall biosynthesis